MKKIYSILVAYNPKENEIESAVKRLKLQTDLVVLCNNSDHEIVFNDSQVRVFNFGENLGIAKAQSIGMKWAFGNGADFILQMDQDSIPHNDLVKQLLECYIELTNAGYKVGLVGSQVYDKDTGEIYKARIKKGKRIKNTSYYLIELILSSDSLIPKNSYIAAGEMDNGLFIDIVDFEYCWRLRNLGFEIIRNNKSSLAHKLGRGKKKIFGSFGIGISSPIRNYYQVRNVLLVLNRNYVSLYWKFTLTIKVFFNFLLYPFALDNGYSRFKFMLKGLKDGLLGKTGRIDL